MKRFTKPSLLKIILFILIVVILYYLWNIFILFPSFSLCPLYVNTPKYSSQAFSVLRTIQLIPTVITSNYDRCYNISQSLIAAKNIVLYGSLLLVVITSYILSCGIVYPFIKKK